MLLGLAALGALSRMGDVVPDPSDDSSSTIDIGNPTRVSDSDIDAFLAGSGNRMVEITGLSFCPPCRRMVGTISQLEKDNPGQIMTVAVETYDGKYGGTVPHYIFNNGSGEHYGYVEYSTIAGWLSGGSAPATQATAPVSTPPYQAPATVTAPSSEWGSPPAPGMTPVTLDGKPVWVKYSGGQPDFNTAVPAGSTPASGPYLPTPAADATPSDSMVTSPASSASRFPFPTSGGDAPAASGNVAATVNTAAGPGTWDYVLQHGNPTWQAVIWNGQHAFKRKGKNQFSLTMNGLGAYSKHRRMRGLSLGALKTVSVPSYTTKSDGSIVRSGSGGSGGGISIESAGMILGGVAGLGIIGYVLYKTLK